MPTEKCLEMTDKTRTETRGRPPTIMATGTPADTIILKFGSVARLASAIGRTPSAVYRWRQGRNGRPAGYVPLSAMKDIMDASAVLDAGVEYQDFVLRDKEKRDNTIFD